MSGDLSVFQITNEFVQDFYGPDFPLELGQTDSEELFSTRMARIKKIHPLQWVFEPLQERPDFFQKKMFGCEAAYWGGRLSLVLAAGEEPWNGLMVCTDRSDHPSLQKEFKALQSHAILGKWLYVSQSHPDFEEIATALVNCLMRGDARIGIEPKPRKKKKERQYPT